MKILCITHADFESPGVIENWALDCGYEFEVNKPYAGEMLLQAEKYDVIIIMGGPQSPPEGDRYPYLLDEVALIKSGLKQGKKILGFCLGAQLIGEALGARTERSPEKEVGVYPIELTEEGYQDALFEGVEKSFPVIHWHNDMPGLTQESRVLAKSEGCPRQVVKYAPGVYGFQCHMEITHAGIEGMIRAVPGDLDPSKYTQSAEELLKQNYDSINQQMHVLLDRFIEIKSKNNPAHSLQPT